MSQSSDPFSASVIPFQVPEQMRAFAEKGVSQARENYARLKGVAENGNGTIEAVLSGASKGASEYVAKVLEIAAANTNAGFDFVQRLASTTSLTEGLELWTSHTRAQIETSMTQAAELTELTQKIAAEMASPIKAAVDKTTPPAA